MKRITKLALTLALALGALPSARAASLLLDFGPTAVLAADALRNPAHTNGLVPLAEATWNQITTDTTTLNYSDGSSAAGVTVALGRSIGVGAEGNDIIDFNDDGYNNTGLTGTAITAGVYTGTSPVRDGIFGGTGANNLALGARIDGLPAGTYRVLVVGRNSNTSASTPMRFYSIVGASADSYAFTTNDATVYLENTPPPVTSGFAQGDNYGIITATIGAGQSLYIAVEGTSAFELRGFINAIAILPGTGDVAARITANPAARTILESATTSLVADGYGSPTVYKEWRLNGAPVVGSANAVGVNSNRLVLRNITTTMGGSYTLFVSNTLGAATSAPAALTVVAGLNTAQMSNIWNLVPGDRVYITTANTERGIAYNSVTTNVLMAGRTPTNLVVALDAYTGAEKHFLDVSGIVDGTLSLNQVGVADDGAVFAANLTTTATSPQYKIYRWASDAPGTPPSPVFIGDPGLGVQQNLRWGDSFAIRGAGADTQILITPGAGTNVVLLRTVSGADFQTEIPPAVIAVSGVPANFGAITLGVAFGPSTNTFWAKAAGGALYLIQFDLNANTASVIQTYGGTFVAAAMRGIAVNKQQTFLAGTAVETPNDNVRLYDVSSLTTGPLLRDQEAYNPQNANANGTAAATFGPNLLFALDSNNGIKGFLISTSYVPPSVSIATHPTDRTVMAGASATFSVLASSTQPLVYRWRLNGNNLTDNADVSGANTNVLILRNITTNLAGVYSVLVSNVFGSLTSSNATLTVLPTFNTAQVSNVWNLEPGERAYLGTNTSTERGLAYNPATTNLILVSRLFPDPTVAVIDARTGAAKHVLDTTGIGGTTPGVSLGLNTVGVADDGAIYGASVTVSATSPPFNIYRWQDDSAGSVPVLVFAGDPGAGVEPNLGYVDSIAVRGAGDQTQILVPPRALPPPGVSTNIILLRSTSTLDFQTEIPPAVIAVSGVPNGFAQLGVAFGPGTNTFWAKNINGILYLIKFDLNTLTGTVLHAYTNVPLHLRGISVDKNQQFLAGLTTDVSPNVRIYSIADLDAGPIWRDQEVFATANANVTVGGTGTTAFGDGYLFALDSNNGIKAFLINEDFVAAPPSFPITSVRQENGSIIFTWPSATGNTYQVQSKEEVSVGWANVGASLPGTGGTLSFTNPIVTTTNRFFRVLGQ